MAIRRLSIRNLRFLAARTLVSTIPRLRDSMVFYDAVLPMQNVGRVQSFVEEHDIRLRDRDIQACDALGIMLPPQIVRTIELVTLDNATVLGPSGVVVDEVRKALLVPRGAREIATYHDFRPVASAPVAKADGLYVNMMGSHKGYRHYFHFMFDRLPRLFYAFERFGLRSEPLTILTNAGLPPYQRDIFRFIETRYPNVRVACVPPNERWRVKTLLHIDDYHPIKRTLARHDMLEFIRALVFDGYRIDARSSANRRIYVTRNDTPRRRIANEADLLPVLSQKGVEVIAPGKLNFRDQVALFASAQSVAGPHGAGLTNILFAPPSARVLELFPSTRKKGTYLFLSLSLRQDYAVIIGGPGDRKEWFRVPREAIGLVLADAEISARDLRRGAGS